MTVKRLCGHAGLSRQAYYKARKARQRQAVDAGAVVELVKRERQMQPRLGTRKLQHLLRDPLAEMGITIGRDRLLALLRREGLLIERKRRRGPQTTDSRHRFRTYENLLEAMTLTGPNQAWVSDITYVRTEEGWLYVSLISDAWSRKIVGYAAHETLEARGSLLALSMAMRQLPKGAQVVHHSDRGVQYCCWDYVNRLEKRNFRISMTEVNHCYENAQAERLNGILKQEYGLGETLKSRRHGRALLAQAVELYNTRRPHIGLNYRIPSAVHAVA